MSPSSPSNSTDNPEQYLLDLATGFALGELNDAELKDLYEHLRNDDAEEAAKLTWKVLAHTLDMRMKLSPQFLDTIRHRIEHGDGVKDDAFSGGILGRIGKKRAQLDPIAAINDEVRRPLAPLLIIATGLIAVVTIIVLSMASVVQPVVRHVSGGKVNQEGAAVEVAQVIDHRQIALGDHAVLTLEWPNGDMASVQGPATILAREQGLTLFNGQAWFDVGPNFHIGLPDFGAQTLKPSRLAVDSQDHVSSLGVEVGTVSYKNTQTSEVSMVEAGQALWNASHVFKWQNQRLEGIRRDPLSLKLDPVAGQWSCSFTVSLVSSDAVLRCTAANKRNEEVAIHIEPGSISAHKGEKELWRFQLSGTPRGQRRVNIRSQSLSSCVISMSGLDKKIEWHIDTPIDRISMQGTVAVVNVRYGTGPSPIPDFAFVQGKNSD
ncbi:MAG: hypothetical protein HRU15_16070 [Planctomycetes bacterium]|nr:hypothetical protein [Planctomycetota bacterium]